MSKFFKYLKAQTKRAAKFYPVILVFTVVLTVTLIILLGNMINDNKNDESKVRITLGVVGDLEGTNIDFGISAIQNLDASRHYVDFVSMSKEDADNKLKKGDIFGYLEIPDAFVEALNDDEKVPLLYVSKNSPTSITPMLTKELVEIISYYLMESQNAIYGLEEIEDIYGIKVKMADSNLYFINRVMSREEIYESYQIGVGNGMTFSNYYVFAFIILLILIWGLSGSVFLIKSDMSLPRLLKSSGYSLAGQVFGDYLPFLFMMLLNLVLLMLGLSFSSVSKDFTALELAMSSPMSALIYSIKLIPAVACISAMQFFLYELCHNTISAVLTQLLAVLSLSYASGLLYPLNALPEILQSLASGLPTGAAFNYTAEVLNDNMRGSSFLVLAGFFLGFMLLSALVREYKMRSNAA
ncbi:MAG: ABC transporter permease [Ruminococcaceae bacterium]|nr:ABC transporter permease [Oscillospiraceae bacterium]